MKASIKFRDEQKPLLRAKLPLNILNFPFQSGIVAGESKELSLNLSTFFDSGPSVKFSYRPNDPHNPFGLIFKTGIGNFGSPNRSPLTMSAEFNLVAAQNPSFFIHFKPDFGDFSMKKSHSSAFVKTLGEKFNGVREDSFTNTAYLKGSGFLPVTDESKAAAGQAFHRLVQGTEMSARTSIPLWDFAAVNFRWGLRFPPQEKGMADEIDAVMVGGKRMADRTAGIRLPLLVMNKIGIEHVTKKGKKSVADEAYENLAKMCTGVKKQMEVIQSENGLLSKAVSELRSDIAGGKMEFLAESLQQSKAGAGNGGEKKGVEKVNSSGLIKA